MSLNSSIKIAKKFTKLMDYIREVAERDCWSDEDNFCAYEYSGGNFGDAYEGGQNSGEVMFARYLLKLIEEQ